MAARFLSLLSASLLGERNIGSWLSQLRILWAVLFMFVHANLAPAAAHYHPITVTLDEHIELYHHEDVAQHLHRSETYRALPGKAITAQRARAHDDGEKNQHSSHWHAHIHEVFDAWDLGVFADRLAPAVRAFINSSSSLLLSGYRFGPLRPPSKTC